MPIQSTGYSASKGGYTAPSGKFYPTDNPNWTPSEVKNNKSTSTNTPTSNTTGTTKVDLYYNLDSPSQQYSRPTGNYNAPLTPVPNPVKNPQNVQSNTNKGTGYTNKDLTNAQKVDLYYNIDNPSQQYTKPTGDYGATAKPLNNPSYSVTSKDPTNPNQSIVTTYTYTIDPSTIQNNVNQKTENPNYSLSDVNWSAGFTGKGIGEARAKGQIMFQDYVDFKVSKGLQVFDNKVAMPFLNAAFTNVQTGKVETESLGYRILSYKTGFSATNTVKFMAFAPFMQTGYQTYKGIFGNAEIQSKNNVAYLSPLDKLNINREISGLSAAEYKATGKEVLKIDDTVYINQYSTKEVAGARSLTLSTTELNPTGEYRMAGFTKGVTYVNLKTLSGNTFAYTTEFTFQSRITDISLGSFTLQRSGITKTYEDIFTGKMSGVYYKDTGGKPLSIDDITTVAKYSERGGFTEVANFKTTSKFFSQEHLIPNSDQLFYRTLRTEGTGRIYDLNTIDATGFTFKELNLKGTSGGVVGGGGTTTLIQQKEIVGLGASSVIQAEKLNIISMQSAALTPPQAFDYAYKTGLLTGLTSATSQNVRLNSAVSVPEVLLTTSTAILTTQTMPKLINPVTPISLENTGFTTAQSSLVIPALDMPTGTVTRQITRPVINPVINPDFTPNGNPPYIPPFMLKGLDDSELSNRVLKGGKKKTQYSPSAWALIFKVAGKYKAGKLSKSGIDFRPITKGFKIKVGGL